MKNLLKVLLLTFLFSNNIFAQVEWCPPGAQWIYTDFHFNPDNPNYITINYVEDTIINNVTNKILQIENMFDCSNVEDRVYTYQSTDRKIYAKFGQTEDHIMIYDFDVVTGDSWSIPIKIGTEVDTLVYVVGQATEFPIDNIVRSVFSVSKEFKNGLFGVDVLTEIMIEGFGDMNFLFPWKAMGCSDELYKISLTCYTDSLTTLKRLTNDPIECGLTSSLDNISEDIKNFSIFPNPSTGIFQIENFSMIEEIEIYDVSGRSINYELTSSNEISIANQPGGIYLVRLLTKDKKVISKKLIKQ
ncbi:MAG: T9SS type A sorting domain-containing protein [Saprospiraceae bacterium]